MLSYNYQLSEANNELQNEQSLSLQPPMVAYPIFPAEMPLLSPYVLTPELGDCPDGVPPQHVEPLPQHQAEHHHPPPQDPSPSDPPPVQLHSDPLWTDSEQNFQKQSSLSVQAETETAQHQQFQQENAVEVESSRSDPDVHLQISQLDAVQNQCDTQLASTPQCLPPSLDKNPLEQQPSPPSNQDSWHLNQPPFPHTANSRSLKYPPSTHSPPLSESPPSSSPPETERPPAPDWKEECSLSSAQWRLGHSPLSQQILDDLEAPRPVQPRRLPQQARGERAPKRPDSQRHGALRQQEEPLAQKAKKQSNDYWTRPIDAYTPINDELVLASIKNTAWPNISKDTVSDLHCEVLKNEVPKQKSQSVPKETQQSKELTSIIDYYRTNLALTLFSVLFIVLTYNFLYWYTEGKEKQHQDLYLMALAFSQIIIALWGNKILMFIESFKEAIRDFFSNLLLPPDHRKISQLNVVEKQKVAEEIKAVMLCQSLAEKIKVKRNYRVKDEVKQKRAEKFAMAESLEKMGPDILSPEIIHIQSQNKPDDQLCRDKLMVKTLVQDTLISYGQIDSGSQLSLISSKFYNLLKRESGFDFKEIHEGNLVIKGIGSELQHSTPRVLIKLQIGKCAFIHKFLVTDYLEETNMLIGLDMIKTKKLFIKPNKAGDLILTVGDFDTPLTTVPLVMSTKAVSLKLQQDIDIPPLSCHKVSIEISPKSSFSTWHSFLPLQVKNIDPKIPIHINEQLVTIPEDNKIELILHNDTMSTFEAPTGWVVAQLNTVDKNAVFSDGKSFLQSDNNNHLEQIKEDPEVILQADKKSNDEIRLTKVGIEEGELPPESAIEPSGFEFIHPSELMEPELQKLLHNEEIPEKYREELVTFIRKETPDIISKSEFDIGNCTVLEQNIELTTDKPVTCRPYKTQGIRLSQLKAAIHQLEKAGMIVMQDSDYSSACYLIGKRPDKDHTGERQRLIVNYKPLNSITKKSTFPLVDIQTLFNQLSGKHFFTALDVRSGFQSISVKKECMPYTAMITPWATYCCKRMPFGLTTAPSTFVHAMSKIFHDMHGIFFYMDDILVSAQSEEEMVTLLKQVFRKFQEHGLKIVPSKATYFSKKLKWLGNIISGLGRQPDEAKIAAIKNMSLPNTIKDVQVFMGHLAYLCSFIPNYSEITSPISELLKQKTLQMTTQAEKAFYEIKEILSTQTILYHPRFDKDLILQSDASHNAIGGLIYQAFVYKKDKEGLEQLRKEWDFDLHTDKSSPEFILPPALSQDSAHRTLQPFELHSGQSPIEGHDTDKSKDDPSCRLVRHQETDTHCPEPTFQLPSSSRHKFSQFLDTSSPPSEPQRPSTQLGTRAAPPPPCPFYTGSSPHKPRPRYIPPFSSHPLTQLSSENSPSHSSCNPALGGTLRPAENSHGSRDPASQHHTEGSWENRNLEQLPVHHRQDVPAHHEVPVHHEQGNLQHFHTDQQSPTTQPLHRQKWKPSAQQQASGQQLTLEQLPKQTGQSGNIPYPSHLQQDPLPLPQKSYSSSNQFPPGFQLNQHNCSQHSDSHSLSFALQLEKTTPTKQKPKLISPTEKKTKEAKKALTDDYIYLFRPISFYSKKLTDTQRTLWAIYEKECYALLNLLLGYEDYIYAFTASGQKNYVILDNQVLIYSFKFKAGPNNKLSRWVTQILALPYDIIINYVPTNRMGPADYLSRMWTPPNEVDGSHKLHPRKAVQITPLFNPGQILSVPDIMKAVQENPDCLKQQVTEESSVSTVQEEYYNAQLKSKFSDCPKPSVNTVQAECNNVGVNKFIVQCKELQDLLSMINITLHQRMDTELQKIIVKLENGEKHKQFYLFKGLLKVPNKSKAVDYLGRTVIPQYLRSSVLALYHIYNHSGGKKLLSSLEQLYYWENMKVDVQVFANACLLCSTHKHTVQRRVKLGHLKQFGPLQAWTIDYVEGLKKVDNKTTFLNCVECFSGYTLSLPVANKESPYAANLIEKNIFCRFGPPSHIILDNALTFHSKTFRAVMIKYNVKLHFTTRYRPESHSLVEISNKNVQTILRILCTQYKSNWIEMLPLANMVLNMSNRPEMLDKSPHAILFGTQLTWAKPEILKPDDFIDPKAELERLEQNRQVALAAVDNLYRVRDRRNKRFPQGSLDFPPGTLIYVKDNRTLSLKKTQQRYFSSPTEVLADLGSTVLHRNLLGLVKRDHKSNIKRCEPRTAALFADLPLHIKLVLGGVFDETTFRDFYTLQELPSFITDRKELLDELATVEVQENQQDQPENNIDHQDEEDYDIYEREDTEEGFMPQLSPNHNMNLENELNYIDSEDDDVADEIGEPLAPKPKVEEIPLDEEEIVSQPLPPPLIDTQKYKRQDTTDSEQRTGLRPRTSIKKKVTFDPSA